MIVETIAFYLFSAITIAAAVMVISARNPVHSVLFLILAFFNSAALFVLMGAEFLAMILVVVYVGAVAVLFLFVVMMLDINFVDLRQGFLQYLPVGGLIGLILFVELAAVMGAWVVTPDAAQLARTTDAGGLGGQQHAGIGADPLYRLCLPLPSGWSDPAGRHDRRHRADLETARGRAQTVDRDPDLANPGRVDRNQRRTDRKWGLTP